MRDSHPSSPSLPPFLHPSSFILHPSSFILHPSSFILHPSSFILHPSSFILHPSSFILASPRELLEDHLSRFGEPERQEITGWDPAKPGTVNGFGTGVFGSAVVEKQLDGAMRV